MLFLTNSKPPWEDETGEEGVAVDKMEEGQKLLVVGKRYEVEKGKKEVHDCADELKESYKKLQSKMMKVTSVTQANGS